MLFKFLFVALAIFMVGDFSFADPFEVKVESLRRSNEMAAVILIQSRRIDMELGRSRVNCNFVVKLMDRTMKDFVAASKDSSKLSRYSFVTSAFKASEVCKDKFKNDNSYFSFFSADPFFPEYVSAAGKNFDSLSSDVQTRVFKSLYSKTHLIASKPLIKKFEKFADLAKRREDKMLLPYVYIFQALKP